MSNRADDTQLTEDRFRALVEHSSDVFMVVDRAGNVSDVSPSVTHVLGYDARDLARFVDDLVDEPDRERARAILAAAEARPGGEPVWAELRVRDAKGAVRWLEVVVTNHAGDSRVKGLVCNMRDVSERKGIEAELEHRAHHDQLTGLPNRVSFLARVDSAVEEAREAGTSLGVLYVDVDRFKEINDSLGHDAGDHLLHDLAHRLRSCVRPQDLVARYGGDEFSVLLEDLDSVGAATAVADRIADALGEPLIFEGHEVVLTASVGIAVSHAGDETTGELMRHADLAMFVAKDQGRSGWELFDSPVDPGEPVRRELEDELWDALDSEQLVVRFQPEFSLASGDVVAAEALVRWPHPTRGLLEPDDFLPLAKETNLIVAVDRYVLRQACRCAREWWDLRSPRERAVVSVNLSPRFLRQPDVVEDIVATMRETGADPRGLRLEITERTALTDIDQTVETLEALRRLGIRVAIDDFGTGYSSLSYLKRLPVDVVKLDRSFVESMDQLESDVAIVQAVITMSHALGMKVTAEGVERVEQAARLRRLGCDTAMGWYWTSAVDADAMADILQDGVVREDIPVVALARAAAAGGN
ncbi:MAG TPA: bifunctional diguanylate cyclase/phosphodiesterase [Acidimicrobiia bacterium]|nr:bifunctional diguanylate cyclase/phosphodiesterase [Acidimicrobiia bacterium]